jgi:hypothetical protein
MTTVINYITTGGLYVLFGLWSFFQVLEYKYYTRVEQYDTIVENMKICKQKYIELLVKMTQLENRVDELEDILLEHNLDGEDLEEEEELEEEEQLSLDTEALKKAELEELNEVKEVEQMANEEVITNVVEKELNEVSEVNEVNEVNEVKEAETVAESLEDEMVDISEETYPIKNQAQNKKGWLKTILFM